ncbi:hypothetical protein NQD34_002961 [Periophthalmus magnuspinnatus]|nr:hypothetical protein NQD34_002961 [Periophthalmus magnuspinnatus]
MSSSGSTLSSSGSALSSSGSALSSSGSALSSSGSALSALSCHFTWALTFSRPTLLKVWNQLIDICPDERTSWRGQNYNLQGFLQQTLGHSSEALSLLHSASEALRGPELLVNYSDLAWVHHERGEHAQSQEYMSKVQALRREYPAEGEHPEVLAEKAWTLMKFGRQQKLEAVTLFEAALGAEPEHVEWRSAQVIALMSAQKHDPDVPDQLLQETQRAHEDDPENLYLCVKYLSLRGRRGEAVLDKIAELEDRIMSTANSSYSGLKAVLRYYRHINHVDGAIVWAEEALVNHPDSRYVKHCVALCYKWRVLFHRDRASQRHLDRAISLYQEVIQLYPNSALVKELDLADLYAKSERSRAEEIYSRLLQMDMEPPERQMFYNRYAKYAVCTEHDVRKAIRYHKKAAAIDHDSFFRENSLKHLQKHTKQSRESILVELQSSSLMDRLEELQCHFTWELNRNRSILFSVKDRLQDLVPDESASWRGQNYNLQGFLQQTLGHSSEALRLLHSASEALRGPGLLVNYSDLAWVYYKRDEHVQCQEYLSKVEALRREYPTEGDQLHPEVLVEKAFSLMEFYNDKKLLAAELLEKALKQQPTRWEWLSAQAMALVSAHRHKEYMDEKVLLTIRQAIERDPDNLELQAEYLNLRVQREENGRRRQSTRREGGHPQRGRAPAEEVRVEVAALSSQLLKSPHRLLRDIKSVLEVQRRGGV